MSLTGCPNTSHKEVKLETALVSHNAGSRRPLKVRSSRVAQSFAHWLSKRRVTPNQISIMSVVFALLAAACLFALPHLDEAYVGGNVSIATCILSLMAAAFIQARLLCNLFDGMVAVEGGKGTPAGELYNDIPDRLSDPIILIAAGYSTEVVSWAPVLGWAAALAAVGTAYVRTLAASLGAPVDFGGPMAKQHRMACMTLACVVTAATPWVSPLRWGMVIALAVILVGSMCTSARRARAASMALQSSD